MYGAKFFKYLLKIPTFIFCVAFVVLNMQDTTLYYSPLANPVTMPLWLLGIILFSFGFIVGGLLVWLNHWPLKRDLKAAQKDLAKAEKDRAALAQDVIADPVKTDDTRVALTPAQSQPTHMLYD